MSITKEQARMLARLAARDVSREDEATLNELFNGVENYEDERTWVWNVSGSHDNPFLTPRGWELLTLFQSEQNTENENVADD